MRIIIRFKSGFQMPITCEEAEFTKDGISELTAYSIKGIKDNKPIFFRSEDIECIYRDMLAEGHEV